LDLTTNDSALDAWCDTISDKNTPRVFTSAQKNNQKQYQRPTPSISVPIASVVGIIVIIFMMGRIAAERPHIRFVENNAEQVVTNPARIAERKLDNVYFCAAPFYDQQERIH
jgi:hypothetical protein